MKNFLKSIFILLSIFSVIGIVILIFVYIKRNIKIFTDLYNEIEASFRDGKLDSKEQEKVVDAANVIKDEIQKDVKDLQKDVKEEVVIPVKKVIKNFSKDISKVKRKNAVSSKGGLNSRQEQIFNYIKLNSEVRISSVSQIFNKVTPRTLRRDFEKLQQLRLVKQEGKTRGAVYKII